MSFATKSIGALAVFFGGAVYMLWCWLTAAYFSASRLRNTRGFSVASCLRRFRRTVLFHDEHRPRKRGYTRQMNRILVIRGGAIGDFILTLPALKALRDARPHAHMEILGYQHIAVLAEN